MNRLSIEDAVDLAIRNIQTEGFTDIFDIRWDIQHLGSEVVDHVKSRLKSKNFNVLAPSPVEHILIPKSRTAHDYRRAALVCPLDALVFLSIAIYVAPQIESHRIATEDRVVFSYRFAPHDGKLFSEESGFNKWLERHKELKSDPSTKVVVETDISSFYDRINLHRIQSSLDSFGIERWAHNLINDLLTHWSKKDSYGLPIGSNASRILAESVMVDIDSYLSSEGVKFIRFVDDFRMYAPDSVTAQTWLTMLIRRLSHSGLTLNAAKTRIYDPNKSGAPPEDISRPAEQILQTITRMMGSKYNKVPRRFTMPSSANLLPFRSHDLDELWTEIESTQIIEFHSVQTYLIGSLIQQKFSNLTVVAQLMRRCMYGVDYICDMLTRNSAHIPKDIAKIISTELAQLLEEKAFAQLDWHRTRILRVLSTDPYLNVTALVRAATTLSNSSLPVLTAVEGLLPHATRTQTFTIRELYPKVDRWTQRRLYALVAGRLPAEEARAWFRSIQQTSLDPLGRTAYKSQLP